MKRALIFDLDGTLWDSVEVTYKSTLEVCKRYLLEHVSKDVITKSMGCNKLETSINYFPSLKEEDRVLLMDEILQRNIVNIKNGYIKIYEGVQDTIKYLSKGYELFIVSNTSNNDYIKLFLDISNLNDYFTEIFSAGGTNTNKTKVIKYIKEKYKFKSVVYIGDTYKDLRYSKDANALFIHAKYGVEKDLNTKYSISNFYDLPKVLNKIYKKNYMLPLLLVALVLCIIVVYYFINKERIIRVDLGETNITLNDNLSVNYLENVKVSDFINESDKELIDDYKIKTDELGVQEVSFLIRIDDRTIGEASFNIEVVDNVKPLIWMGSSYSIYEGSEKDFYKDIICVDDIDENVKCEVIGEYDTDKVGSYNLVFKATDNSGNETIKDFTLYVKEYTNEDNTYESEPIYINDIIKDYKKENTMIGVDLSSWQEDVDFEKIKEDGVEFVILRVGSEDKNDERFVDSKFIEYIKEANRLDLPVGIYYYSYANNEAKAREEALWVLEQIKDYKVDLPIAFDWENWSTFNSYHFSLHKLMNTAKSFMDTIIENGYQSMLYSSKLYLENFWLDTTSYPVWMAHYVDSSSYKGPYEYWQLTSSGKVNGINTNVDVNIRYLKANADN